MNTFVLRQGERGRRKSPARRNGARLSGVKIVPLRPMDKSGELARLLVNDGGDLPRHQHHPVHSAVYEVRMLRGWRLLL
jgi:hypothetical protein